MLPDGDSVWADLDAWGPARLGDRIGGGSVNQVRELHLDGRRRLARVSGRDSDDLDWEIALLERLQAADLAVPQLVPTVDGRLRSGRTVVMEWVDGALPVGDADSDRVAEYLRQLHRLTSDWTSQRPGWRRCAELVTETRSGPVDLNVLPDDVVERCRLAWARLPDAPRAVIHGDPTPPNVRIRGGEVVLLDWDEARIDLPLLDFTYVPAARDGLPADDRQKGRQAFCAWETALFWRRAPEYARKQLAEVDAIESEYH